MSLEAEGRLRSIDLEPEAHSEGTLGCIDVSMIFLSSLTDFQLTHTGMHTARRR
jgi:hypothetical protein